MQENTIGKEEKQLIRQELRRRLMELADDTYKEFHGGLVPGQETILGVRVPKMRALAKDIAKNGVALTSAAGEIRSFSWRQCLEAAEVPAFENPAFDCSAADNHLSALPYPCYEEILLQGLVVGSAAMDFPEFQDRVSAFVPKIDNWAVCDVFCGTLKATGKHMEEMWDFLGKYLALGGAGPTAGSPSTVAAASSPDTEFPIRFAVVMLLSYYIKEEYIDRVLDQLNRVKHEGYYVKMAVAWAISICFIKFPEKTMVLLLENQLDDFTYNKAIQKAIESYRVDKETKDRLRAMKRK